VRDDNRVANLEWVTAAENITHAFRSLGRKSPSTGKFGGEHPTSKAVESVCMKTGMVTRYASAMDAVRLGFDSGGISHCVAGRSAHHKGHYWRLAVENAGA
jgi:hypothetical protein